MPEKHKTLPMKRILSLLIILIAIVTFAACSKDESGKSTTPGTPGQGGSLARFTIAWNYLYIVDDQKLYAYSLANPQAPQLKSTVNLGFDIETIYSFKDKLFIGSQNAMYIYSLTNPASPAQLGTASHVRACDPVVANDSIAYVTVRMGSTCGGNQNALLIYDVKNVLNPVQRNATPLTNPHGLGLKDNRLYVCDGDNGLFVYDVTDPVYPQYIKQLKGETFYDVIIADDLLVCMIDGGTALFQLGAGDEITLMAKITN
jgi:hypothetical protein